MRPDDEVVLIIVENSLKSCPSCGEDKTLYQFDPKEPEGQCRKCVQFWATCAREDARKGIPKSRLYPEDPKKTRARARVWKYGVTPAQLGEMLDAQRGLCAGCSEPIAGDTLHVDHDHSCCPGQRTCGDCVRGLLCKRCNFALGWIKDDPAVLRALADYLER